MKIRFTADSCCDMSPEFIERYQVKVIPLSVELNGKFYKDGVDIQPDDIFKHVGGGGELPKTAAINVEEFRQVFTELLKDCDAILHFDISSEFSSCWQNACVAAEGLPVYCVDSRQLSSGIAILIAEAQDRVDAGMSAEDIYNEICAITGKAQVSFILDRLDYIYKGGRCSMVAMLGANLLHLRPCIEVTDGKMVVGKKYRGTYERCARGYLADRLREPDSIDPRRVFITHTGLNDDAVAEIHKIVMDIIPFSEVYHTRAGCSITSHCGENTFGVIFMKK